jgi:hypothetical protein
MPVARTRISRTGKLSVFFTLSSRGLGAVQSALGVGGCGNISFGHVLAAIRQGQHRDAVATGEERLGRCAAGQSKFIRLYLSSGKLILAATYFDEFESMVVALRRALQH